MKHNIPQQISRKEVEKASDGCGAQFIKKIDTVETMSVDPKTNGGNYRPHITVWAVWGDRSHKLKDVRVPIEEIPPTALQGPADDAIKSDGAPT